MVGSGAAAGLGVGALPSCGGSGNAAEEASKRARLAVDLARQAAECCAQLPLPGAGTGEPLLQRLGRHGPPGRLGRLLDTARGAADAAVELCSRGAAAALGWAAHQTRATCGGPSLGVSAADSAAAAAEALVNLTLAVGAAAALGGVLHQEVSLALAEAEAGAELPAFLASLTAGTRVEALAGDLARGGGLPDVEPALLARFFCASAATALLEWRGLVAAARLAWLGRPDPAALNLGGVDRAFRMEALRLASDFLNPASAEDLQSAPGPPGAPGSPGREGSLLLINLPLDISYAWAQAWADEVERHLEEDSMRGTGGATTVVWLEAFSIVHTPRLANRFREDPRVEVLWKPLFALHERDANVWAAMPSLAHLLCGQVRVCWWLDLLDEPPLPPRDWPQTAPRGNANDNGPFPH